MARGTRAVTRERLLEAAAEVFSAHGYAGTSVDAIAEQAGLTTGALYSNFSGKREIFLTALRHAVGQSDTPQDAAPATPGLTPAQNHLAAGRHFLSSLDTQPNGFRLLLWAVLEANRDPQVAEVVAAVFREQRVIQAQFMATTPKAGDAELVAQGAVALSALAIGFAVQHLVDPVEVPIELAAEVLDQTIAQLAGLPGPGQRR